MNFKSINPATGDTIREYPQWDARELDAALAHTADTTPSWAATSLSDRTGLLHRAGEVLLAHRDDYAALMSAEMGKLLGEARAEIEKCARCCTFYAEHAAALLADENVASDATSSHVAYQPLGTVLAIMPWNFPFWQVIRAAAPALTAGNCMVLKHANNVTGCALALEQVFREAGYPDGVFRTLMIGIPMVDGVIRDARIHAVTLTGSERAGRALAATAGDVLKKCVLELGGSDAFVVLEDADLAQAAEVGAKSRYQNAGQSCIAAKRFIVVDNIVEDFLREFKARAAALKPGDPAETATTLAPMARLDLRDSLHAQVQDAIKKGAKPLLGCEPVSGPGAFYTASILDGVAPGMRAWDEELFGPVASLIRVHDEAEALRVANGSRYGLGGSVWTRDSKRGEAFARQLQSGSAFVNGLVKSDPRLPFGGIKRSGYGRELARHGIHEFTNVKTLWIG
ncbi:MAG TPA: NAD-dependent succinate-semialdehyde dehydrogenase [Gammaproteobacteria bacterium]|nr:NAD-dependent succinate-semialdehyde dehydrogenase [Gammaproteobacteria bacterium]